MTRCDDPPGPATRTTSDRDGAPDILEETGAWTGPLGGATDHGMGAAGPFPPAGAYG